MNDLKTNAVNPVVTVTLGKEVGEYANAFRILHDAGAEWFLDFLVYSEKENKAIVISRIRVQQAFLGMMRDRLLGLTEVSQQGQGEVANLMVSKEIH